MIRQGREVCPVFLGNSGCQLGVQVACFPYRVVYRAEEGMLTVCALEKDSHCRSRPAALFQLRQWFRQAVLAVSGLQSIRLLIPDDTLDMQKKRRRHRLRRWLLAYGAELQWAEGASWLVIPVKALREV